ncbi:nodulation ABC transporter NodI [Caballeronia udeis]|uniref:Nodulation ABC transporter NodI n=1 Tax=Caballeronia udeis TaxID=1232866 RepID=A0A158JCS6_9BURK|nr:cytochrome c biogenesis heme-transporting ATPase CcmA [Caballeronia udeis]SAL66130.1 nodulation ABC transporter NodI [Caballeronia udeis]
MNQNSFVPSERSPASSGDALLSVDKLAFDRAGQMLFKDIAFDVGAGQVLQIHGPNGSGKTTLLRVLAGLLQPSAGTVRWRGKDAHARPDVWRQSLAYLGHLNGISDDLTAAENLSFSSVLGEVAEERVEVEEEALKSVGLDRYRHAIVRGLSQGQKRRLAISRLLLEHKPLWLLDEPAAALDAESSGVLERCIAGHIERGGIVLMTTHKLIATAPSATRNLYFEPSGRCSD